MSAGDAVYLGDGVYASFDGYAVYLHTGSHLNAPVVVLEPYVYVALSRYHAGLVAAKLLEVKQ